MRTAYSLIAATLFLSAITAGCRANTPENGVAATSQQTSNVYWQNAKLEVDKGALELLVQHKIELARGIKYHKLIRGNRDRKEIAITFDDGPHPKYTPKLLSILKRYNAKATFFVVGEQAAKYPFLVKAEIAAGHQVGNHTYHHVNLTKIPVEGVATEIKACGDVIKSITGTAPHAFRPPGGDYNTPVAEASEALGYTMILWTDDPGDYASPGDIVIQDRLLTTANNGGIVLIHDGVQQTVDVLPRILAFLHAQGYKFITIDEMMKNR